MPTDTYPLATRPDFSRRVGKGGALQAAEKRLPADNHAGAQGATPPDSGGEFAKDHASSNEEGWRAERRRGSELQFTGGAGKAIKGWHWY